MIRYTAALPSNIAAELESFILDTLRTAGIQAFEIERWNGIIEINYVAYEALRDVDSNVDGHMDEEGCLWVNGLGYQFGIV